MDKKAQNSDTGDIKKQKPYFDKNRLFGVWIPSSLYEWFQQYLEYSYGKMPPDRFRAHAYINTKELLEKGYGLARIIGSLFPRFLPVSKEKQQRLGSQKS